jgi:hypothetical protein
MYTDLSPEDCEKNLRTYLDIHKDEFFGNINREVATIFVKTNENNYWKPNLALRIERDDNITAIRGIYGPTSAVWTFFMFLYFLFIVGWMVFFTLYYVEKQINTHNYPWALPCSLLVLVLIGLTYAAARLGQFKAKDEMNALRRFAEEATFPLEKDE